MVIEEEVIYHTPVGINVNGNVHWLDPTIAFDPRVKGQTSAEG